MKPALEGQTLRRFAAPRLAVPGPQPGTLIEAVEAKGKYLLVHFGDGRTLETHMKMTGSWHLYRSGERWQRSKAAVRALIETEADWIAVCFAAPHVKLTANRAGPAHLGPDLTGPNPDLNEAAARFSIVSGATPLGVAMLDQRICCGVGNVYKSEVLHALGLSPLRPVASVTADERQRLVATSHDLLRRNLGGGVRITVPGVPGGLAAYGKAGEPCHRCNAPIQRIVQGEHVRSTYWCSGCQS